MTEPSRERVLSVPGGTAAVVTITPLAESVRQLEVANAALAAEAEWLLALAATVEEQRNAARREAKAAEAAVEQLREELAAEEHDVGMLCGHLTKIYEWASQGVVSKPTTLPEAVIALAEARWGEEWDADLADALACEHKDIAELVRRHVQGWHYFVDLNRTAEALAAAILARGEEQPPCAAAS